MPPVKRAFGNWSGGGRKRAVKNKLAGGIVRWRRLILALLLLAAAVSALGISKTRINYDLTQYLSPETMTRRALTVMQEEFGASEQLRVMFHDLDAETLEKYVGQMNALPGVQLAVHDPETGVRVQEGITYQLVTLTLGPCDAAQLVRDLRGLFPEAGDYAVGGTAASQLDVQRSVGAEMPEALLIAVAVVLAVLLLSSNAWLEPVLILFTLAVSILINMGTNLIFPNISFVTFAVCAILQLALSIDYAIMLLNSFHGFRDGGLSPEAAMEQALAHSMMPISSSALTTVAGLLSLLVMSFTIGFDIGLVLSKGILISMLTVFLLLPALTLSCGRALEKTRHKPLRLGGARWGAALYKARRPVALALAAAVAAGAVLQAGNSYIFSDAGRSAAHSESAAINQVFGASDPLVLLIPGGETEADYEKQRALVSALEELRAGDTAAIREISAMVTTGAAALKSYGPTEVAQLTGVNAVAVGVLFRARGLGSRVSAEQLLTLAEELLPGNEKVAQLRSMLSLARTAFEGPRYSRMLLTLNVPASGDEARALIPAIMDCARAQYGEDFYLTGTSMSVYDIGNAFESDLMLVNVITLLAILLIVALSFRSIRPALLLVFVIEGAIWISMAFSRLAGEPIFFISYLICVSIQMGATIDYGILLTDHYKRLRAECAPCQALQGALRQALPTILTSGAILATAGFIIGKRCTIYYISSIGLLLSRGTLVSVALILTLLPALLALGDGLLFPKTRISKQSMKG